jgi:hypothetical protein
MDLVSSTVMVPSLVTVGEPYFLSSTTLRPLGPSVAVTARESLFTPRRMACRTASSKSNCFAVIVFFFFSFAQFSVRHFSTTSPCAKWQ